MNNTTSSLQELSGPAVDLGLNEDIMNSEISENTQETQASPDPALKIGEPGEIHKFINKIEEVCDTDIGKLARLVYPPAALVCAAAASADKGIEAWNLHSSGDAEGSLKAAGKSLISLVTASSSPFKAPLNLFINGVSQHDSDDKTKNSAAPKNFRDAGIGFLSIAVGGSAAPFLNTAIVAANEFRTAKPIDEGKIGNEGLDKTIVSGVGLAAELALKRQGNNVSSMAGFAASILTKESLPKTKIFREDYPEAKSPSEAVKGKEISPENISSDMALEIQSPSLSNVMHRFDSGEAKKSSISLSNWNQRERQPMESQENSLKATSREIPELRRPRFSRPGI